MPTVLTIAGSDPSGNAGIQADIRTCERLGVKSISAITAITSQSLTHLSGIYPVPSDILTQQLSSSAEGEKLDSIKIGMVWNSANIRAIMLFLKSTMAKHVVVDTVFASTSGAPLIEPRAMTIFKKEFLPLATLITPNSLEAGILTGMTVWNLGTMKEAAKEIYDDIYQLRMNASKTPAVLIKGGHMEGRPVDLLYDGSGYLEFEGNRIKKDKKRGTGCRLSTAVASYLAKGENLQTAIKNAKKLVEEYLAGKS